MKNFKLIDHWVIYHYKAVRNVYILIMVIEVVFYMAFSSKGIRLNLIDIAFSFLAMIIVIIATYLILRIPGTTRSLNLACNLFFYFFSIGYLLTSFELFSKLPPTSDTVEGALGSIPLAGMVLTLLYFKPIIKRLEDD